MRMVSLPGRRGIKSIMSWAVALVAAALLILIGVFSAYSRAQSGFSHTFSSGWRLISVPLQPTDPSPLSIFFGAPQPLRVYAYRDGLLQDVDDPSFTAMQPGEAYWALFESDTPVTIDGMELPESNDQATPIEPGWNLLGTPFLTDTDWSDARIEISNGATQLSLSAAIAQGWIEADLRQYETMGGNYTAIPANGGGQLTPWNGYQLFSNIDGEVVFIPRPPVAQLQTPADLAEVTFLTDVIGTATAGNLAQYELTAAPVDASGGGRVIYTSSTPVEGGVLGMFDPTLLENGLYRMKLTATDSRGRSATDARIYQVSGDAKVGIAAMSFVDLQIPVSGIPITITRHYDSRVKTVGDFGVGWRMGLRRGSVTSNRPPGQGWQITSSGISICQTVQETSPHLTHVRLSDREFFNFRLVLEPAGAISSICLATARFEFVDGSSPGASLEINDGTDVGYPLGSNEVFLWSDDDQVLGPAYDPGDLLLKTADGRSVTFVRDEGGIVAVADENNNSLTIAGNGVVHSSGKSVSITRDTLGRITRITDPKQESLTYEYDNRGDLITFRDAMGHATTFEYDGAHNLVAINDPLGASAARLEYDEEGRLVALVDGGGNRHVFTHDVLGREETTIDARGAVTRYVYDERGNTLLYEAHVTIEGNPVLATTQYEVDNQGNELSITDPDGVVATGSYDQANNLLEQIVDPSGANLRYAWSYDPSGNVLTESDPAGRDQAYAYDGFGNLLEWIAPDGMATAFTYGGDGAISSIVDPIGNSTTVVRDVHGWVTEVNSFDDNGVAVGKKTIEYDANGNVTTETLHRMFEGVSTEVTASYEHDAANRLVRTIDPMGGVQEIRYNELGQRSAIIDANGNETQFAYDATGAIGGITYPDLATEQFEYDAVGNLVRFRNREGNWAEYEYDELNRRIRTIQADGSITANVYTPAGRLAATIDTSGNRTDYVYDSAGRQVGVVRPAVVDARTGSTVRPETTTEYVEGFRSSLVDANGNRSSFGYDAAGRMNELTYADGTTNSYVYDELWRPVERIDESGNSTHYEFDSLGNLTRVLLPSPTPGGVGPVFSYTYDSSGNLRSSTDPLGRVTRYEYDDLNRLVLETLALGQTRAMSYDPNGNLVALTDFDGMTTNYEYDVINRPVMVRFPDGTTRAITYAASGAVATVQDGGGLTTFSYDQAGRLEQVDQPGVGVVSYDYDSIGRLVEVGTAGQVIAYGYDQLNRLATVSTSAGDTAYGYDPVGNVVEVIRANGIRTQWVRNSRHLVESIVHQDALGAMLERFEYGYTLSGQREQIVELDGSVETFTYDGLGRLVGEARVGSQPHTRTYEYNLASNLTRVIRDADDRVLTYDDNDQLLTVGGDAYAYDARGNLASVMRAGESTTFEWDAENRMVGATGPFGDATFEYDSEGMRVSKAVNGETVRYLIDKQSPAGHAQVIEEVGSNQAPVIDYVYGLGLLEERTGGSSFFYLADAHGSTRKVTDSTSAVVASAAFDGYGNLTSRAGRDVKYLHAGEQYDADLSAYYLRARYYDPRSTRFLGRDPFEGVLRAPLSLNRYLYANGDPVNRVDPSGRMSMLEVSFSSVIQTGFRGINLGIKAYGLCRVKKVLGLVQLANSVRQLKAGGVTVEFDLPLPYRLDYLMNGGQPFEFIKLEYEPRGGVTVQGRARGFRVNTIKKLSLRVFTTGHRDLKAEFEREKWTNSGFPSVGVKVGATIVNNGQVDIGLDSAGLSVPVRLISVGICGDIDIVGTSTSGFLPDAATLSAVAEAGFGSPGIGATLKAKFEVAGGRLGVDLTVVERDPANPERPLLFPQFR